MCSKSTEWPQGVSQATATLNTLDAQVDAGVLAAPLRCRHAPACKVAGVVHGVDTTIVSTCFVSVTWAAVCVSITSIPTSKHSLEHLGLPKLTLVATAPVQHMSIGCSGMWLGAVACGRIEVA